MISIILQQHNFSIRERAKHWAEPNQGHTQSTLICVTKVECKTVMIGAKILQQIK